MTVDKGARENENGLSIDITEAKDQSSVRAYKASGALAPGGPYTSPRNGDPNEFPLSTEPCALAKNCVMDKITLDLSGSSSRLYVTSRHACAGNNSQLQCAQYHPIIILHVYIVYSLRGPRDEPRHLVRPWHLKPRITCSSPGQLCSSLPEPPRPSL